MGTETVVKALKVVWKGKHYDFSERSVQPFLQTYYQ